MIDEDFNFEETVSSLLYGLESVMYQRSLSNEPKFVPSPYRISFYSYSFLFFQSKNLAVDRKEKFQEEIRTLTGSLKAHYDQANKEYAGTFPSL